MLRYLTGIPRPTAGAHRSTAADMKRKAKDDPPFDKVRLIKTEEDSAAADYSQDVKKKISASARTGQACDRCRVSTFDVRGVLRLKCPASGS